ncbi:MAG: ABC transporter permease [Bacilli bacterium]
MIFFKKCTRSIKHSLGQFIAIIGIATIAVTLFLGLASNSLSLSERTNRFYNQGNAADVYVTCQGYNVDEESAINNILLSNGGGEVVHRGYLPTFLNSSSAVACIYDEYPIINKPIVISQLEDTGLPDDCFLYIDDTLTHEKNYKNPVKLGDEVTLSIETSYILMALKYQFPDLDLSDLDEFEGTLFELPFKVTGTMQFVENIQNGDYSSNSYVISKQYVTYVLIDLIVEGLKENGMSDAFANFVKAYLESYMNDSVFANQYLVKVKNQKKVNQIVNDISFYYENKYANNPDESTLLYVSSLENQPFNSIIQMDINQSYQLMIVFPFLFFFVAILVILTTISQLIIKERTEIGTLKALGVKNSSLYAYYMILMLVLVGVGIVLGSIIGPLLIPYILNIKYSILYTLPTMTYVFPFLYFFIIVLAMCGLTCLCVYFSTKKEISLCPSESMRPKKVKVLKTKSKVNVKKEKLANKLISMKMALRNIRLNLLKSIMVVVGVMGCTALLVAGFGIEDTLNHSVDYDMEHFYQGDVMLTYNTGSSSKKDEILSYFSDEIESINEMRTISINAYGKKQIKTTLFVLEEQHDLIDVDFDINQVMITQKVANDGNYKVGDTIEFDILNNHYSGVVGKIGKTFSRHGIYVSIANEQYASLLDTVSVSFVKMKSSIDETPETFGNQIIDQVEGISIFTTQDMIRVNINSVLSSVSTMTLTIKVFAILLAVVVLYNLAFLNFKERIREMATLKVLGFPHSQIAKSLIYETMILVFIGAILGLCIGFPVEYLVLFVNRNSLIEFLYTVFTSSYIISFVISFITGLLINVLLSLSIKKVKMVESLKSVE